MFKGILLLSGLFLSYTGLAFANETTLCGKNNATACPLELVGSSPSIDSPVACNSPAQAVTYTLINNVPRTVSFATPTIETLIGDTAFATVVITGGSCLDNDLVPANGSCTIDVLITPLCAPIKESGDTFPQTVDRNLVVAPNINQGDLIKHISLVIEQPSTGSYLTTLVGDQIPDAMTSMSAANMPMVLVHTADDDWINVDTSSDFQNGIFNSSTCTGTDASGICVAVGAGRFGSPTEKILNYPLFYVSQDGGSTWDIQQSPSVGSLPSGSLNAVSCTNDGNNTAGCLAVGTQTGGSGDLPLAYFSNDGGLNWTDVGNDLSGVPKDAETYTDVDCTGSSANNFADLVCVVLGLETSGDSFAAIFVATEGAGKFEILAHTPTSGTIIYQSTSCTGSGSSAVCTIVGQDDAGNALILTSIDGGNSFTTWNSISGFFDATSCTTTIADKVVCVAAGSGSSGAALYINKDVVSNPATWVAVNLANNTNFRSAVCETNTSKTICMVTGIPTPSPKVPTEPTLYVNQDVVNTNTWTSVSPTVEDAIFGVSACTVSFNDGIACTTGGALGAGSTVFSNPDILSSTWGTPSISLTQNNCIFAAGASGHTSSTFCSASKD